MTFGTAAIAESSDSAFSRTRLRALAELAVAYALILAVIWSPRPWQRPLWIIAAVAVIAMMARSWHGRRAIGLRTENFWRSLWVVGAALAIAAGSVMMASHLDSLRLPSPPLTGIGRTDDVLGRALLVARSYWAYSLWAFVQQFLLQGFFLLRLMQITNRPKIAAFVAAGLFALAHLPNPILMVTTVVWGFSACMVFLRYRNLYPLAIAHAIFGITLAITIPGPVIRNMRVGHRHAATVSLEPQRPDSVN